MPHLPAAACGRPLPFQVPAQGPLNPAYTALYTETIRRIW
ncbi:protein of unknown function [Cupriavidus neocaledonicus]|uniref:Uncharacterized protein n=1 Tax=Cupriavidus neocaledonicus TaxID=1040979 RepID=A0A375GZ12_9BURK|nr:hypothetical protein CBM2605_A50004 [Cupriavidus neocaledonicus]SPD45324.1 protein of unknown function [Cupriavidus neocaledonicus]